MHAPLAWRSYATLARSCASLLAALHPLHDNEPPTSTISTLANSRAPMKLLSSGLLLQSWFLGLPESTSGYVQQIQAMLELVTGDGLGQHVRCIFRCVNLQKHNTLGHQQLPDLVEPHINMLGSSMIHLIVYQINRTLTITMHPDSTLLNTQFPH